MPGAVSVNVWPPLSTRRAPAHSPANSQSRAPSCQCCPPCLQQPCLSRLQVTLGQKKGQAMRIVSRCLWDTHADASASEFYENETLYCVCQVCYHVHTCLCGPVRLCTFEERCLFQFVCENCSTFMIACRCTDFTSSDSSSEHGTSSGFPPSQWPPFKCMHVHHPSHLHGLHSISHRLLAPPV